MAMSKVLTADWCVRYVIRWKDLGRVGGGLTG